MTFKHAVRLARPEHWIKNVLVFLPVLTAKRMGDPWAWLSAAVAAAAFCLISSAAYIVNDIRDRANDRLHPRKRNRPLAAGQVTVAAAATEATVLLLGSLAAAAVVDWGRQPVLILVIAAYILLQLTYSFMLKRIMLMDAICIALGFVLRAAGGAVAIRVVISPWLFVCTFSLCLFLAFCKRRNEIVTLGGLGRAGEHRSTLSGYTPELLTHLITLSAAIAIIAFLFYAINSRTVANLGTTFLLYTLPLVVYAVCRFAMLSMGGRYADPTDLILHDRPFRLAAALWATAAVLIIRYGPALSEWLSEHYR